MKASLKTTLALVAFAAIVAGAVQAETIHSVTQVSYNFRSQPVCTVTRMNPAVYGSLPTDACALGTESTTYGPDRIAKNTYNAAGELTQVDQAYGTSVQRAYARYAYSLNGAKQYETDANNNTTQYGYDGFDRPSIVYYPCPSTQYCANGNDYEQFAYDANDNRTWYRRRDGNVITYAYDNLNRETVRDIPGGTSGDVYTGYDGLGRLTFKRFVSTSGSGVSYSYDGLGRVSSTTDMNGRTVSYLHNSANARTRMLFPDGNYIDYALDNANRVKSFGWNDNWSVYAQGFNNLGQKIWEAKGGHTGVSYGYDALGRLTSMTNDFAGTTSDIGWTFGYNPAGQVISNDASSVLYDYEELSSITEPAQTHDGLNRVSTLVGVTGACPSGGYDARANLICDGTGRSYAYDIENRLLSGNIAGNTLSLTYDPEGRLASYTWNGGTTTFLYDGVNLIGEYNSSSQLLRRYVHGPGTDNPVAWYEGSGNASLRYFYTNYQGSVITTADSTGNRGDIYAYGAYGEPKDQYGFTYWPSIGTGSTSVSRFGYTGQMFLADARLYYYKARIYDPQLGRFLQTDPIGAEDDLNLYAYVGGDPVNQNDPEGTQGVPVRPPVRLVPPPRPAPRSQPAPRSALPGSSPQRPAAPVSKPNQDGKFDGRSAAFRAAKDDARIPKEQQPDMVGRNTLRDPKTKEPIRDKDGNIVETREYHYRRSDDSTVIIQEHSRGHDFGGKGDRGPHFNVRPRSNPQTGKVEGTREHYEW